MKQEQEKLIQELRTQNEKSNLTIQVNDLFYLLVREFSRVEC